LRAGLLEQARDERMVVIYGKNSCPYTQAARDDYARRGIPFDYVDVKKNAAELERMLVLSKGRRAVPVIVETDGTVTVGFGGT
jgi:glutaredoxin 3